MIRRRSLTLAALIGATGIAVPSLPARASTAWREGPALPLQVQEIYPVMHRGRIHVAGGIRAFRGQLLGATYVHVALDPQTGRWVRMTRLPRALHHPQLLSASDTLFCIGGFRAPSLRRAWVMSRAMWRYDETDHQWHALPDLPHPAAECMAGVIGDQLHLCGGRTPVVENASQWQHHADTDRHLVRPGAGDAWQRAAPLPVARNSGTSAVIDGNLHVVAGRTVARINLPDHHVYDAREDRWRSAAPLPQGQSGLAGALVDGKWYVFGGEAIGDSPTVYPQGWVYDPGTDAWSPLPDMPRPRHGHGAVAIGRQIYTIGGARRVGGNDTSDAVDILQIA